MQAILAIGSFVIRVLRRAKLRNGLLVLFRALLELHGVTVKTVGKSAFPPAVHTQITPVIAPAGTVAVIWVSEPTVKVAFFPLWKVTSVAPVKLLPVMVTVVPTGPLAGVKLKICGVTQKILSLVSLP